MSISIYSFYNNTGIVNNELKAYYDVFQLNEDKLHKKLNKTTQKKLKKQAAKEELTDIEIVKYLVNEMRGLKELVKGLDEKIVRSLDYQDQIKNEYNVKFVTNIKKTIMKERLEYEKYIRQFIPVDILQFERFENEYNKLMRLKLPFENILPSDILGRIGKYVSKYQSLESEVNRLEGKYERILANLVYYDHYNFDYQESDYFTFDKNNFGKIGENYYKNNELIERFEFDNCKNDLKREVTEKKTDFKEHYEYLLENNYSFVLLNAYSERKFVSIGKVRKYDSWYLIIDHDQIILYSKDGYV